MIDFPLPDSAMHQLALSTPAELSREVDDHVRSADALVQTMEVRPDNLYRAMQEYRQALAMCIAGTERLPQYSHAASGLAQATKLFNVAIEKQIFEIDRALRERDPRGAYWASDTMMQMIPDKTDPTYQRAYRIWQRYKAYSK
jgi:hypothetical protein